MLITSSWRLAGSTILLRGNTWSRSGPHDNGGKQMARMGEVEVEVRLALDVSTAALKPFLIQLRRGELGLSLSRTPRSMVPYPERGGQRLGSVNKPGFRPSIVRDFPGPSVPQRRIHTTPRPQRDDGVWPQTGVVS